MVYDHVIRIPFVRGSCEKIGINIGNLRPQKRIVCDIYTARCSERNPVLIIQKYIIFDISRRRNADFVVDTAALVIFNHIVFEYTIGARTLVRPDAMAEIVLYDIILYDLTGDLGPIGLLPIFLPISEFGLNGRYVCIDRR